MTTIIFDLEGRKEETVMKCSVGSYWSSMDHETHRFIDTNIEMLMLELDMASLIVGFNLVGFDYKVLKEYEAPLWDYKRKTFDIFIDVAKKADEDIGLDWIAWPTLGRGKRRMGSHSSTQLYESGQLDELADYNEMDTELARDIFFHGLYNGYVNIIRHDKQPLLEDETLNENRYCEAINLAEQIDTMDWQTEIEEIVGGVEIV